MQELAVLALTLSAQKITANLNILLRVRETPKLHLFECITVTRNYASQTPHNCLPSRECMNLQLSPRVQLPLRKSRHA